MVRQAGSQRSQVWARESQSIREGRDEGSQLGGREPAKHYMAQFSLRQEYNEQN